MAVAVPPIVGLPSRVFLAVAPVAGEPPLTSRNHGRGVIPPGAVVVGVFSAAVAVAPIVGLPPLMLPSRGAMLPDDVVVGVSPRRVAVAIAPIAGVPVGVGCVTPPGCMSFVATTK